MANVIQIKHGISIPTSSSLAPYELGYATVGSDRYLYIGNPTDGASPIKLLKVGEVDGLKTQISGLAPTEISEFTNVVVNNNTTSFGKISKADFITALDIAQTTGAEFSGAIKLTDVLVVSGSNIMGTVVPSTGTEGQIFFQIVG